MKRVGTLFSILFILTHASVFAADIEEVVNIGNAEVFYDYQLTDTGNAMLTFNAVIYETNNSLRGLKNTDQRRLSKLGQLIYQCKLMLYQVGKGDRTANVNDPILISKNYSLFTGVDVPLAIDERVGVQAQALGNIDENSLFKPTLGDDPVLKVMRETVGEGSALNLRQFDVNILSEPDLIETSDSIDFTVRFPVFQLEKPVSQWFYNFDLKDFKKAYRYIEENCTPVKLVDLINLEG